ncbi:AmmeMemoRadiSam system protein B [Candidatus Pacearchaeota archaeon]|nr:AmmeMemoRadiSam system protein B [Candidatus Pacearchaeota archaeon]
MWYPSSKRELEEFIDNSFKQKLNLKLIPKKINGLIVPHAGYEYSGLIAGKAFSLLKNKKINKAIILGPSHYISTNQALTTNKLITTPLGKIKTFNITAQAANQHFSQFPTANLDSEHSINNQIPFLQKLGIKQIMPLMIGNINNQAKEIAEKIAKIPALYIFSTDLSHFLTYEQALKEDKQTINIIENLDINNFNKINACGIYPLMILFELCKLLKTKPHLIEYKNSGDITGDKSSVVGYSSFWF